jgi:hypothetical protein
MEKKKKVTENEEKNVIEIPENVPDIQENLTGAPENVPETMECIERPKLTVVIPYLRAAAQGNELLYAVRSLAKNFKEDFNIVIIGDREEWFSEEITHIDCPAVSNNPQMDVINKIRTALGEESISDGFIWTNDDIYFISPVILADIQVLKTEGKLRAGNGNSIYSRNRNETIRILQENKLPAGNFATHTPVFFEKEKINVLFESFPELQNKGLLFSSLYFNRFFNRHSTIELDHRTDCWKLRIVSNDPDPNAFNKFVAGKKWLNNAESGWGKLLQNFLRQKFAEPCRFEAGYVKKNS